MAEPRTSIEIIAPSVEEAVRRGATELGLPEDRLAVEVLDEGGKGLLGLASRQARVRLTVRVELETAEEAPERPLSTTPEEDEESLDVSQAIVSELLDRMGIQASVNVGWGEASEPEGTRPLQVDIRGRDLSVLIGRRGETLMALQYIARLIVAKELSRMVPLVIDVEGYRARRERQLRQLAQRMASQALESDRTMALEPMPANERRIIHLELRDHEAVYTESVGEGDHRKVTIIPRQSAS